MSNLATRLLRCLWEAHMWQRADAVAVLAALGPGFELIGSVARRGFSDHDLDILRPGVHPWLGRDPDPTIQHALAGLGFVYASQQVLSPADKSMSRRTFGPGWNEIHTFVQANTGQKIEIWTQLPETTAFGGA